MNTEELVVRLARDAAPVTPLRPPAVRLLGWLIVTVLFGVLGLALYGVRTDRATMATQPGFVRDLVLGMLVMVAGGFAALVLAVPGREHWGVVRWTAVAGLAAWTTLVWTAVGESGQGFTDMRHWPACAARILSVGLVPAVVLLSLVHRGASLRPSWSRALGVGAAAAGGALTIQLTCPIFDPGHVLLGHVGPVIVLPLLAAGYSAAGRMSAERLPG